MHCGVYQLCLPLGLEQADMSLLERIVKRRQTCKRGEVLFRPGDDLDYVYAIRGGAVKTYVCTEDGRVQITGFHFAGELLGLSALASRRYSCEAMALETTSVCKVAIGRLDELARKIPVIQYQLIRIMSGQIQRDEELLLLLGKRSAEERLAAYLLGVSRRFARRNFSATQFTLSMSRGDIGNYLGVAEETVCRIFSRFHEQGVVTIRRRNIQLNDLERLRQLAQLGAAARPEIPRLGAA